MSTHSFTTYYYEDDGEDETELELKVTFRYSPGRPATPPAYDHGGLPPDPPEIDIMLIDQDSERVTNSREFDRFHDWLIDKFADAMIERAKDDIAAERDRADEYRAEERRERMREERRS